MKTLKLQDIIIDAGTQTRVGIDQKTVQEYTELVMDGVVLPPVDVFFDGIKYYLVDGFHRYLAHTRAVKPEINVTVHNGTVRDALKFAAGANHDHGLKRTIDDKRNSVRMMLNDFEYSQLSDRDVAKICNVSHTFVAKTREDINNPPKKKEETSKAVDTPKTGDFKPTQDIQAEEEEKEYLVVNDELATENEELKQRLAVKAMDATPEEKELAEQTMADMKARIKQLEIENKSLKASRDLYQSKVAELVKQVNYWKREAKKS